MSSNGKINGRCHDSGALPGQFLLGFSQGYIEPGVAAAIEWLRRDGGLPHTAGCQCRRCVQSRAVARAAVSVADCNCGWCPLCWAAGELRKGRL